MRSKFKCNVFVFEKMSWTVATTLSFIEDYRQRSILWDSRDRNYKNNGLKKAVLQKLAIKYGLSIDSVRKKIKNLRTIFHREHKKLIVGNTQSSEVEGKLWFAYKAMRFILQAEEISESPSSETIKTELLFSDEVMSVTTEEEGFAVSEENEDETHCAFTSNETVKSEEMHDDLGTEALCKSFDIFSRRDDFAVFGEYVGNEIRKLPPTAQMVTKRLINNILFNAAIGKYSNLNNENIHLNSSFQCLL